MTYEVTSYSNNYQVEELLDESNELEATSLEATSLGEFLRSLALGLGAVFVTSIAVYLAVAIIIGLGLSGLN